MWIQAFSRSIKKTWSDDKQEANEEKGRERERAKEKEHEWVDIHTNDHWAFKVNRQTMRWGRACTSVTVVGMRAEREKTTKLKYETFFSFFFSHFFTHSLTHSLTHLSVVMMQETALLLFTIYNSLLRCWIKHRMKRNWRKKRK